MSSSSKLLKACVGLIVLLVGALGFLIVDHHQIRVGELLVEGAGNMKQAVNMGKRNSKLELNYVSKRKVPNGPDPIHNRRAGKSRRPPGHAR